MNTRLTVFVFVAAIIMSSLPSNANAQDVTSEEVWTPIYAEVPQVVESASLNRNDYVCFWEKVVDETVQEADTSQFLATVETPTAYSGNRAFRRFGDETPSGTTTRIKLSAQLAIPEAELVFIRAYYRGIDVGQYDNIVASVKVNGQDLPGSAPVQLTRGPVSNDWQRWEVVLPQGSTSVDFELFGNYVDGNSYDIDQVGIGWCKTATNAEPEILPPGDILSMYAPVLLFGGQLRNHGTSAIVAFDPRGLRSFELLWEAGEASKVLNRQWGLGDNPAGWHYGGLRLGDKLWMAKDSLESWSYAGKITSTRCFSEVGCANHMNALLQKIAQMERSGNSNPDKLQHLKDVALWMEGKIGYYTEVVKQGRLAYLQQQVNLVFEVRGAQLSESYSKMGRYQYILDGRMPWSQLRAIEMPAGTSRQMSLNIWKQFVASGAPRITKLVVGDVEEQISLWTRYTGQLRSYNVPSLIAVGGTALTATMTYVRSATALANEYALPAVGAVVGGDALLDTLMYVDLDPNETSMSWDEYLVSENLLVAALSGRESSLPIVQSIIGYENSSLQICIPQEKEFLVNYDLHATSFTHPQVCSFQWWKISAKDDNGVTISKVGTDIQLPLSQELGGSTYSMASFDRDHGMILADFWFELVRFDSAQNTATIAVSFVGFRTSEELGLCYAWLPPEKSQALGREQCAKGAQQAYLPAVSSGR